MSKFKVLLCLLTTVLVGCSWDSQYFQNEDANELPYTFSQFTDIPIPDGSQMDLDRSMMFGRETDWMGKVTFYTPYSVSGVFDFYMEEMPKFNWRELTSVRGSNSVLTYSYNCRVATIQLITASGFRTGSTVIISMAPSPAKRCQRDSFNKVDATERNEISGHQHPLPPPVPQSQPAMMQQAPVVQPQPAPVAQQPQPTLVPTQPSQQPQIGVVENNTQNQVYNYQQPYSNNNAVNTNFQAKSQPGSLGLGDASNMYYKSNSNGVGQPPRF